MQISSSALELSRFLSEICDMLPHSLSINFACWRNLRPPDPQLAWAMTCGHCISCLWQDTLPKTCHACTEIRPLPFLAAPWKIFTFALVKRRLRARVPEGCVFSSNFCLLYLLNPIPCNFGENARRRTR